jgi:hypothetical protein
MNANCGKVYFKVPADIAPGNYLVRAEVIALHVASSAGGAQFYAVRRAGPTLCTHLTFPTELLPDHRCWLRLGVARHR